LTSVF